MKKFAFGWVLYAALGVSVASAQAAPAAGPATTLVEPPAPLLPTNAQLLVDETKGPADRAELAAILAEDGLKRTEPRAVAGGGGWLRAYQFVDATGAFSAYTYFRQGGKTLSGGFRNPTETVLPGGEVVFLSGVSVVRAQTTLRGDAANALLASVQTGLPKVSGRRGLAPLLPTLLPLPGLDAVSLRYALGPAGYGQTGGVLPAAMLGWDKSAEVVTAAYGGRSGKGTLTLLLYPTPQIAGDRGRAIEQAVNPGGGRDGKPGLGTVKLRRVGPLLAMTSGGFSDEQAQALVNSVRLNQEISFDKPMPLEFHAEVRKTATLLQQIAIFTGVGILAALVLGIFFGVGRAGIRVLQGKPAYTEPEFLRIDLRGRVAAFEGSDGTQSGTDGGTKRS